MWSFDETAEAPVLVDRLLADARISRATDVHLQPTANDLRIAWRVDGVLHDVATVPREAGLRMATRIKVLAELLTYRVDLPQEGRIRSAREQEVRVSTFPTVFGERVALRLFAAPDRLRFLADLGLPQSITDDLARGVTASSGAMLFTGPAGSGKTTTAYACLREIARSSPKRSLLSVEDPVEAIVEGVAQSQLDESAGFDYPVALKSLLRQDPQVVLVGEIRDAVVARTVVEASLTGHLVLSTFHAGSAAAAIRRLLDMGIEPYHLRSALRLVTNQHLVRTLCDCAEWVTTDLPRSRSPRGCDVCAGTGYSGRMVAAERFEPSTPQLAAAMLADADVHEIEAAAKADGVRTRLEHARELVAGGTTAPAEVQRVFGFHSSPGPVD